MEKPAENYQRYMLVGLVITLLLIVGASLAIGGENVRLARAAEKSLTTRTSRGQYAWISGLYVKIVREVGS